MERWRTELLEWLETRLPWDGIRQFAEKKRVPIHRHSLWYYLGGITLFLFLIQILTGILLLLYYRPSADAAYESVQFIVTEVHFGWLIRNIHSWSANLLVGAAMVHMFSVFLLRAYRPPRELTWVTGMLLMVLMLAFGFSGYLLPWNELAYFATKVGTEMAGVLPLIGHPLMVFLRGGEDVTGGTLTRFFGFHIAILPGLTTIVLAIHLFLVQVQGMSAPPAWEMLPPETQKKHSIPFLPHFLLRDAVGWLLAVLVLIGLASLFPWELGLKADPLVPAPAGIKPEWYFLFMFQTLKLLPSHILTLEGEVVGICAFGICGLLWFLTPWLDRPSRRGKASPAIPIIGAGLIAYIIILSVVALLQHAD